MRDDPMIHVNLLAKKRKGKGSERNGRKPSKYVHRSPVHSPFSTACNFPYDPIPNAPALLAHGYHGRSCDRPRMGGEVRQYEIFPLTPSLHSRAALPSFPGYNVYDIASISTGEFSSSDLGQPYIRGSQSLVERQMFRNVEVCGLGRCLTTLSQTISRK